MWVTDLNYVKKERDRCLELLQKKGQRKLESTSLQCTDRQIFSAYISIYIYTYIYLMAAATAADPKESHHGFVEGTGRYGRAASSRSAGLEPRC